MSNTKEIRSQIICIQNTKKITKAMEMVAVSKMRKTQERMLASLPYAEIIHKVIKHLTLGNLEYKHPYFHERKVKKIGYIVISTDRGLAGSLNINLFKQLLANMKKWNEQGITIELALVGCKAVNFFNLIGSKVIAQVTGITDDPKLSKLIGIIKVMLQAYDNEYLDKLYLVSNKFVNVISQIPQICQILPIPIEDKIDLKMKHWDYIYEPDSKLLLNILLQRYIESQVYQSVVENLASEQAARMVAMKAATENADTLMKELKIVYNKARQNSITQEINEIVAGASAV
ncbi:F0F1 ATP synthase subunit gamma [Candidatus Palibaumannia cicadellinicola]|uniref:ATP synthase gamma chain n=1 Tax=Baumannia cicadellinicola subsp. Homalodisca coagulata TaxID=374463 RepID=ATPG_BAUCH|nr:F0F1 ATP synthase subunit gamma [Candidatus Baumannia cicadellinicola]Q1LTV3.1 RecName: Full=ATP synthase gamma chain; AltName: Full=ATP synthase F1 sector gamma subunit; AltName: Full=F-ATPase gamma subunit [Baumannia cicadellinicola str. Hc (Homalodisca coagulata)]ABF14249.1 ATP synthase F1, gamma subunit [Baumannia cicadellinicola str. Hc (Homalodisca coagulata)]MBS0032666.1 F0F1 ATP synthase subunit gamma [Candidatus Baumannia cicadellinicola]MCJ7462408.1 F0F1 ATP synthase subunit gamma 